MPAQESTNRLSALRQLLSQEQLSTQDDLRTQLAEMRSTDGTKFKVTQSTISRDLRRLGAVRAVDADGRTVYRLPDVAQMPSRSDAQIDDLVLGISHNGAMIVIHTRPGSASMIARHLDVIKPAGILGTIAGDDTVFVAPSSIKTINASVKSITDSLR